MYILCFTIAKKTLCDNCRLKIMRENYDVVFSAIYFSPVLEHYKYMKYLNREKNTFWLIITKL